MKAIEINGVIKTFSVLPKSWNDGERIHENIKDYAALGFKDVVIPHSDKTQTTANIHLEGDVYTYDVVDLKLEDSLAELKENKIAELKSLAASKLSETDWYIIREADSGEATPDSIRGERAAIRTESDELVNKINSLKSKKEVVLFNINL